MSFLPLMILATAALTPVTLAAEVTDSTISFEEGLSIALRQGVEVRRAQLDSLSASASLRDASNAWQPDLSFGASTSGSLGSGGGSASLDSSLQSSMTLWQGGQLRNQRRAAEANAESARLSEDQASQDVAWSLLDAWISLDQTRARLDVAQANLEVESATLDKIQAMVDAGSRTRADAASQRASVAEAAAATAQAEGNITLAELSLARLIRLDPAQSWVFEQLDVRPVPMTDAAQVLLDQAAQARPDLAALAADLRSADATVAAARASSRPSLSLGASLGTGWNTNGTGGFADQLSNGVGGNLGLQLQVPLWDRRATQSAVERAEVSQQLATLTLEEARDESRAEVLGVLEQLRTAQAVLEASVARLQASEEAESWTRQRFEAGASLLVELVQARSTLEDAREAEIAARYDVLSLQWELAWVTGSLELH